MKKANIITKGVEVEVKERATERAIKDGFSTLNGLVRFFLAQYAVGNIELYPASIRKVSKETNAVIAASMEDIREGRLYEYKGGEDFQKQLEMFDE